MRNVRHSDCSMRRNPLSCLRPLSAEPRMSQPAAARSQPRVEVLPRVLGPFDAVTIVVGSIIGSRRVSQGVSNRRRPGLPYGFGPIMLVWIVMGLVTLCGSLALAELAAMLPHAGGPYVYLREATAGCRAFLWGWTEFWIVRTGSLGQPGLRHGHLRQQLSGIAREQRLPAAVLADLVPLSHWAQCVVTHRRSCCPARGSTSSARAGRLARKTSRRSSRSASCCS